MTISLWRYSHLALAISSFLLLSLASITGVILSFEPVVQKVRPYKAADFNEIKLSEALPALRSKYPEISELTVDANQFVQVNGTTPDGEELSAYVDPRSGKILGTPEKQSEFFQWMTALHRSLFLHEAGRFFVGLTAFLLILIAISGTLLIVQRQGGIRRFFTRIVNENFAQHYHVVLGRLLLIPILLIALSGTYLSLLRFEIIPAEKKSAEVDFDSIKSGPQRKAAEFEVFRNTRLSEVQSVEFPFSEDVEDYYILKLKDRELAVNQVTGEVIAESRHPFSQIFAEFSLDVHTGRSSILWAIVLAVASASILFFIYSGFAITFRRLANRSKNKFRAEECRYILLVGSENGSTFRFASYIAEQLIHQGEKAYVTELNKFQVFPKAEHLIVLTSTYGLGEAPANARQFAFRLERYQQPQTVQYSVLGFGSHSYPDFCRYAFEVNQLLSRQNWASPLLDIHTVNDKSPEDFNLWAEAWSQQAEVTIPAMTGSLQYHDDDFETLKVEENTSVDTGNTFLIRFSGKAIRNVRSGDLLAIYPANDHRERLYSIGRIGTYIQLSVRLHDSGLGSSFLHKLRVGETMRGRIVNNEHFHFPEKAPEVVMISNGTGIAPFLGMIDENDRRKPCYLYCGFRESSSLEIYRSLLESNFESNRLTKFHVSFSREGERSYVNQLIERDSVFIARVLQSGGVLMICGSLSMQKDVTRILEAICQEHLGNNLSFYQSRSQILTDCY